MFTDGRTGVKIYANLDEAVSRNASEPKEIISMLLEVVRDTPEYAQLTTGNHPWELEVIFDPTPYNGSDRRWYSSEVWDFQYELFQIADNYAPDGYYFGNLPDDDYAFGYWKRELLS